MTVCPVYSHEWEKTASAFNAMKALRPRSATHYSHDQHWKIAAPEYKRIEAYWRRQPPMGSRTPCKCGSADAWLCWHRVRRHCLLGLERSRDGQA